VNEVTAGEDGQPNLFAEVELSEPADISLDLTDLEFLRSLLDTEQREEAVFLVERMLVSRVRSGPQVDLAQENLTEVHRRFGTGASVPAAILGIRLSRVTGARWYANSQSDSRNGRQLQFIDAYEQLTGRVLEPDDVHKEFFECSPDRRGLHVRFFNPMAISTQKHATLVGQTTSSNMDAVISGGDRSAYFIALGNNRLYGVYVEASNDGLQSCDRDRSFATLMTWRAFNFETYERDREASETDALVASVSELAQGVIASALGDPVQVTQQSGDTLSGRGLRERVNSHDLEELKRLRELIAARPDLDLSHRQALALAQNVEAWARTGDPVDLDPLEREWRTLAERAEFAIFTHAARKLDQGRWSAAADDLGRAFDFSVSKERKSRYCHLRIAALYHDWQAMGRAQIEL
jgi:hypothetical protein